MDEDEVMEVETGGGDEALPTRGSLADQQRVRDLAVARARERRDADRRELLRQAAEADEREGLVDLSKVQAEYETAFAAEAKLAAAMERKPDDKARRDAWNACWRTIERAGNRLRGTGSQGARLRERAEHLLDEQSQAWHRLVREERAKIERLEATQASRRRKKEEAERLDAAAAKSKARGGSRYAVTRDGAVVFQTNSKASAQSWKSKHKGEDGFEVVDREAP